MVIVSEQQNESNYPKPQELRQPTDTMEIVIPGTFCKKPSQTQSSEGIWTNVPLICGQIFGPFEGILRGSVQDLSAAWEVSIIYFVNIITLTQILKSHWLRIDKLICDIR